MRPVLILVALAVTVAGSWATTRGAPPIVKLTTALDGTVGMRAEAFDAKRQTVRIRFDPDRYGVGDVRAALRARGFRIDADAASGSRR